MVFSVINDDDNVIVKFAQCNNCGIVHKITDVCTSEIIAGKEVMSSIVTVEDMKPSMPPSLVNILERNNAEISTWELAQFIIEQKQWGSIVVLTQEEDAGQRQGKYVRIMSDTFFKVETFTRDEVVVPNT
jgi:hypothetical protein